MKFPARLSWLLFTLAAVVAAPGQTAAGGVPPADRPKNLALIGREPLEHYIASIEQWRAGRLQRLQRPTGWLALIGLHPLAPGRWSVGAGADNVIRLAAGPEHLGTITHADDGKVSFALAEDVAGSIDGTTARSAELPLTEEKPVFVRAGSVNFYVIERGGKLFLRVRDAESPRLKSFAGIESYPIDPAWRIEAAWVPFDPPRVVQLPDMIGLTESTIFPGKAVFSYAGKTYELIAIQEEPGADLFFVITDTTAGTETYEACRFFYAPQPKDGKVILDFNKVYNPPCAFTPFATCPLPPKGNALPFALRAGEKKYSGDH